MRSRASCARVAVTAVTLAAGAFGLASACSSRVEESPAPNVDAGVADVIAPVSEGGPEPGTFCAGQLDKSFCSDFEQDFAGWQPAEHTLLALDTDPTADHRKIALVTIPAAFNELRGDGLRKEIGPVPSEVTLEFDLRLDEHSIERVNVVALMNERGTTGKLTLYVALLGTAVHLTQYGTPGGGRTFKITDLALNKWTHVVLVAKYGLPTRVNLRVGAAAFGERDVVILENEKLDGQLVLVHGLNNVEANRMSPTASTIRYAVDNVTLAWK